MIGLLSSEFIDFYFIFKRFSNKKRKNLMFCFNLDQTHWMQTCAYFMCNETIRNKAMWTKFSIPNSLAHNTECIDS